MERETKTKKDDNVIFVGKKPLMAYILAVTSQFNRNKEVHIKARGRSISKAVDVAEIVRDRFSEDTELKDIKIGTEQREIKTGEKINVSTIDITLKRP